MAHQDEVARQLDELTDYRPYFTWWVSTVQTLVLLLSLLCYGFGPVGFGRHTHSGQVLVKSLSLQQVSDIIIDLGNVCYSEYGRYVEPKFFFNETVHEYSARLKMF